MKKHLIFLLFCVLTSQLYSQNFLINRGYPENTLMFYVNGQFVKHGNYYYSSEANRVSDSIIIYRYDLSGLNRTFIYGDTAYGYGCDLIGQIEFDQSNNMLFTYFRYTDPLNTVYETKMVYLDTLGNILDVEVLSNTYLSEPTISYVDPQGRIYFSTEQQLGPDLKTVLYRYSSPTGVLDSLTIDSTDFTRIWEIFSMPDNGVILFTSYDGIATLIEIDSNLQVTSQYHYTNLDTMMGLSSCGTEAFLHTQGNNYKMVSVSSDYWGAPNQFNVYDPINFTYNSYPNNMGRMNILQYLEPNRYLGICTPIFTNDPFGMHNIVQFYLMDSTFQCINSKVYFLEGIDRLTDIRYIDNKIMLSFEDQDIIGYDTNMISTAFMVLDTSFDYIYNDVQNVIINDATTNCLYNAGETTIHESRIAKNTLTNNFYFGSSMFNDTVHFDIPSGDYDLYMNNPFAYISSCGSNDSITINGDTLFNSYFTQPNYELEVWSNREGIFNIPGGSGSISLHVNNLGINSVASSTLVLKYDPTVSFSIASITPSSVVPDSIVWNFSGPTDTTIAVFFNVPANPLLNGYVLNFRSYLTNISPSDVYSQNNSDTLECEIFNSYDPNEKSANPVGDYGPHFIPPHQKLEYQVNFQNTGNFPARNIVIRDTLSQYLNINSIRFLGSSHPCQVSLENGILTAYFNDINLVPSSVNEPLSHGYLLYEITPLNGLTEGTMIHNKAHIFFDYNDPVITNNTNHTITYTIGLENQIPNNFLSIFPNPVKDVLNIRANQILGKIEITDILGKLVMVTEISNETTTLNTESLSSGIYTIRCQGTTIKFIKQ